MVNPKWFFVGEHGGEIITTCMAGYDGHIGWINYLAVAPGCQLQVLARQILIKAERCLQEAISPIFSPHNLGSQNQFLKRMSLNNSRQH